MKLKLDENLSFRLAHLLKELGHDVHTVAEEGLTGLPDPDIWRAVQSEGRFLVTQDKDFSDIRKYIVTSRSGVLIVRIQPGARIALADRVLEIFKNEQVESWVGCCVVATEQKVRVRRPLT
jgi:predicted nuclease of predicted toxin-antitoxin system